MANVEAVRREYTHGSYRRGKRRVRVGPRVSRKSNRAVEVAEDPSRDTDRVGRLRQRATDHQVVGPPLDRLGRGEDPHLIVTVRARGTDAGDDEAELFSARRANVL